MRSADPKTDHSYAGIHAGCVWVAVAVVLAVTGFVGLGLAGPSALPIVALIGVLSIASLLLGWALWNGFGGRRTAALSLFLGAFLTVYSLIEATGSPGEPAFSRPVRALIGVAIVLASAYALARFPRSSGRH